MAERVLLVSANGTPLLTAPERSIMDEVPVVVDVASTAANDVLSEEACPVPEALRQPTPHQRFVGPTYALNRKMLRRDRALARRARERGK